MCDDGVPMERETKRHMKVVVSAYCNRTWLYLKIVCGFQMKNNRHRFVILNTDMIKSQQEDRLQLASVFKGVHSHVCITYQHIYRDSKSSTHNNLLIAHAVHHSETLHSLFYEPEKTSKSSAAVKYDASRRRRAPSEIC